MSTQTLKSMDHYSLLCSDFLNKLALKHNIEVDKIMIGKINNNLYVWRYDTGAYDLFKTLEIITFDSK